MDSVYEAILNRLLKELKNEDIKKGINIALSAYMDSGYMNYNDMYNDELMSETVDGYLQTLGEMEQYTKYTCCGGLIQDVLPSLDKFGREFVKMGYCPSCQEILYQSTLKDKSPYFSRSELDDDRIYEFSKATENMKHTEAIFSKAADKLSVPEKVIYLFEMDLEKEYYVDNDGKIKKLDETV